MSLFLFFLSQVVSLDAYAYEVSRAKATFDYGTDVNFVDEKIHRRFGKDGSTVDTYCTTIIFRDGNNKVSKSYMYWVTWVEPARGYISDYERGTSETGIEKSKEFHKLCTIESIEPDFELLTSEYQSAYGSRYDPRIDVNIDITTDWVVGRWSPYGTCATEGLHWYYSNGKYHGEHGEGTWKIENSEVLLQLNEDWVEDADDPMGYSLRRLPTPREERHQWKKLGHDNAMEDGEDFMKRC